MPQIRRLIAVALVAGLALDTAAFAADGQRIASRFYGSISAGAGSLVTGTTVSAWVGGQQLAEGATFAADGSAGFFVDVPGDIPGTPEVEGALPGETVTFKVAGATSPQTGAWQTGAYTRHDLTVPSGADVAASIGDDLAAVFPDTTLTYAVTVANRSAMAAGGVVLEATVPEHVTLLAADGASVSGRLLTWPAVELGPGAAISRSVRIRINTTFPQGTDSIVATARVSHDGSQGIDPDASNDTSVDTDQLLAPPDFAIADADLIVDPTQPVAGSPVAVNLTVRNTGFVAGTALVVLYDGRPGSSEVVASQEVTLAAGASTMVSASFLARPGTAMVSAIVDPDDQLIEVSETNNSAKRFLAALPDLAVGLDNVVLAPTAPRAGDSATVTLSVRNAGRAPAEGAELAVYGGEPEHGGALLFSQVLPTVAEGGNQTVRFPWTAVEGVRRLTVVVDGDEAILEVDEDNNRVEREVLVPRAAGADLVVSAVDTTSLQQSAATLLADGTVRATIGNAGDAATTGAFAIRLFEDRDGDLRFSDADQELARQTLAAGIPAGGSAVANLPLHAALRFLHPLLFVEADAESQVAELREDNNLGSCFAPCESTAAASLLPIVEEWSVPGIEVETAPVVAQLGDDNGDGTIDGRDVPDVLFHTEDGMGPAVMARSGIDGAELWTYRSATSPLASRLAHLAAADLDGDGVVEVLAVQRNGRLLALDHRGTPVWTSDAAVEQLGSQWGGSISIGDLSGDGVPEIAVGRTVLSNSGHVIAVGTANKGQSYNFYGPLGVPVPPGLDQAHSTIADVDLDGRAELVAGDALYRLEGNQLQVVWNATVPDRLMEDGFVAVGNLDGDPQAEIVYVSSGQIEVLNHDGTVSVPRRLLIPLSPLEPATFWGGAPTIADLDGDGTPEILVAGETYLVALRAGLATMWRKAIDEKAALTAATVFDLDGNGNAEVLYLDQSAFYVLDGRTGATLYSRPNTSKTGAEYPVVADVDNDGQAEVLLPSNRGFDGSDATQGLHVLGSASWQGTRPIWNEYSYHVTNVQLDGTVPSVEVPSWEAHNTFRANEPQAREPHRLANATVGLPRVGAPRQGAVPVTVRVGNGGRRPLPKGVPVRLYAGDPLSTPAVGEGLTTRPLPPGAWEDLEIEWLAASPVGAPGSAVVDPAQAVVECDEADNVVGFELVESFLPDLTILDGGVTAPRPAVGGTMVPVTVRVTNSGAAASPASTLHLFDGHPLRGALLAGGPVPAIGAGASATVTLSWDTLGAAGFHLVYAVVDRDGAVAETDEGNNDNLGRVELAAATAPDLHLETLTIDPSRVSAGTSVELVASVANRGATLASSYDVVFRANGIEVGRRSSPATMAAGERLSFAVTLGTAGRSGVVAVEALADPANVVAEGDESNNRRAAELVVDAAGLTVQLTTDRTAYEPGDTVGLVAAVRNLGSTTVSATLVVDILDAAGAVLATLPAVTRDVPTGTQQINASWPSTGFAPGSYAAFARLQVGGTVVATAVAGFIIQDTGPVDLSIVAEPPLVARGQAPTLTSTVRSVVTSALADLTATVTVRSTSGQMVFQSSHPIAELLPGAVLTLTDSWQTGEATPAGSYGAVVSLHGAAGNLLGVAGFEVRVFEDNPPAIAVDDVRVFEAAGASAVAVFTVHLAPASAQAVDVTFTTVDGSAVAGADYSATTGTVRFAAGETMRTISVALFDDGVVEAIEQFQLVLTATSAGSLVDAEAVGTIVDDDGAAISLGDGFVRETDAASVDAVLTVTLTRPTTAEIRVGYATADGTAKAGLDYQAVAGELAIPPGATTGTIRVPVLADDLLEATETFTLRLSAPSEGVLLDEEGTVTIADDDGWTLVGKATDTARPGCVSLTQLTQQSPNTGAAWWGQKVDLAQSFDKTFQLYLGQFATKVKGITFTLQNQGQAVIGNGHGHYMGYADSVMPSIAIEVDTAPSPIDSQNRSIADPSFDHIAVDENGAINHRIPAVGGTFPVPLDPTRYEVQDGREHALRVVWNAPLKTLAAWFDGVHRVLYTKDVVASLFGGQSQVFWGLTGGAGTHTDAEEAYFCPVAQCSSDGTPAVSVAGARMLEGESGTASLSLPVTLSCPTDHPVTVHYATVDGTAMAGQDYGAASGELVFAPGETSKQVLVPVFGDATEEKHETFSLVLSEPSGATLGYASAEGQILTDDFVARIKNRRVVEGSYPGSGSTPWRPQSYLVELTDVPTMPVTVRISFLPGTATHHVDFTMGWPEMEFPAGVQTLVHEGSLNGDFDREGDETHTVRFTPAPASATLVEPGDSVITIVDDDDCQGPNLVTNDSFEQVSTGVPGWTVVSGSWEISHFSCCTGGNTPGGYHSPHMLWSRISASGELRQDVDVSGFASLIDAGRQRFTFQAALFTRGAAPRDRGRVVLEYRDASGAALFGSYDTGEPDTVGFWLRLTDIVTPPPGTRMVRIRLLATRSFNFDDSNWLDAFFDAFELRPLGMPTVIARDASVTEGASGVQSMPFRIDLTCPALQPVTLAYATSDGTASAPADYQPTAGLLTIPAGGTFGTVNVPVFGDNSSEGNETISLAVSSAVNAGVQPPGKATGTILDDESTIQVLDAAAAEGSSGTTDLSFRVELSRAVAQEVRVDYATRPGTATAPADFAAATGTLVFAAGETQKTIVVEVIGDTTSEPDEDFFIDLSEPRNVGIARSTAKGIIIADEISLSVSDADVVERDTQTVKALFKVTLSYPSSAAVTAQWATEDALATAGADYRAASGTVTIPAGQLSQTIEIDVFGDTLVEPTETYFLRLHNAVNAGLNDSEGIGRIVDNDDCPSPNLLANGSAEDPPLVNGKIPSWTEVAGFNWQRFPTGPPLQGTFVFFPGSVSNAELRQDVDVSSYAALVDRGIQRFVFEGFIRSAAETPADPGRIVVELLDVNKALLAAHDSGEITNVTAWQAVSLQHAAPAGTRFVRVRLIARRLSGGNIDAYFDALALRSLGTPILDQQGGLLAENAPGGVGQLVLSASCAAASPVTLSIAVGGGTASPGEDYGAIAPTATLPAGATQVTIDVPLVDDDVDEALESVNLLVASDSVVLSRPAAAWIVDDDPEPTLAVTPLQAVETDAGSTAAFVLSLSNPSSRQVGVAYTTRNGSAVAGQDFVQAAGTASFAPGELVREIPIAVLGDTVEEPAEQLYLQLSAFDGLDGPAVPIAGSILDDDPGADCPGPELVANGGNERTLARGDQIESWTSSEGRWKRVASATAPEGRFHFAPPDLAEAVLSQDVDLSAHGTFIDAGTVRFDFSASVVSAGSGPADAARILLEHRDAAGAVIGQLDTGNVVGTAWQSLQQRLTVPVGTRSLRVSLIATRNGSTAGNDAFFDRVSLRAVGVRSVTVADATVQEGAVAASAAFDLTLSCASSSPIAVDYSTAAGTATAAADFTAAQGTVTFPPGELVAQVRVDVLDDAAFELPERFELRLVQQPDLAALRAGVGTIEDDDGAPACTYQPPAGAFAPTLEWAWKGSTVEPTFDDVIMTPAVADLTGDGVAEIVFNSRADHSGNEAPGLLRAIDGLSGRPLFDVTDPALRTSSLSQVAIGDLDGDRDPEVVAMRFSPRGVMAFDSSGRLKWFNGTIDPGTRTAPAIANLDGVGLPEVVVGAAVLNADGTLRWRVDDRAGSNQDTSQGGIVATADLDLDGLLEIVAGNRAWTHAGTPVFASSLADGFPAIGNFDGDPYPEIVVVSVGKVRLLEHDGRVKWEVTPAGLGRGGPPTVADFDDDGQPEIGVAGHSAYVVLEGDGAIRWSATIQDFSSHVTGSSVFDFEGDGSAEVVYRDEKFLRVYRGTDGAVLFAVPNPSCTAFENPVIADVDSDGNAEIVVPRDQLCGIGASMGVLDQGLFVFGDAADNWVSARGIWNQHAYAVTNVDDDATIPTRTVPSWAAGQNTFRAQRPGSAASPLAAPDLLPLSLTVDDGACPARVRLLARIGNAGDAIVGPPVDVTFSRGPLPGGSVLGTQQLASVLQPGGEEEVSLLFDTLAGQQHTFCVTVDAASPPVNECHEQNNSLCIDVGELCRPPLPVVTATKRDQLVADGDGDGRAGAGDVLEYTIVVSNSGNTADDVRIVDEAPAHTAIVGGSVVASAGTVVSESPVEVALPELAAGASVTVSFRVAIGLAIPPGVGAVSNQGRVTAAGIAQVVTDDPDTAALGDPTLTELETQPRLNAAKTAALAEDRDGDGRPSPGDVLGYTIVVRHLGGRPAEGVVLRDPAPAHAAIVSASVTTDRGTVAANDPVEVLIGQLVAGDVVTVRFQVAIGGVVPVDTTEISNQGLLLSDGLPTVPTDDPAPGGAGDPTVTPITPTPKLVAEKTVTLATDADGDGVPSPGDVLGYAIRLRSVGNTTAVGVELTDAVPAHSALVADSTQTSHGTVTSTTPIVVAVGDLAAGTTATVTFQVRVDNPVAAGVREVANQGTVSSDNLPDLFTDDPNVGGEADPTTTVIAAVPVLVVEKTASLFDDADGNGDVSPGDAVLYRVQIANRGNTPATEAVFVDPLPAHTTVVAGSVQTDHGTVATESPVRVDLGQLPAGEIALVTFQVRVDAGFPVSETAISNQGELTSRETAAVLTDDPATAAPSDPTRTEVFIPVAVSIGDVSVGEGAGSASFPITVDRASNHPVTVGYALSDGTAHAPADYVDATGTFTLPAGATAAALPATIVADLLDELDETFQVELSNPSTGAIADGAAVATIVDDDQPPLLSIGDATVEEGDTGPVEATLAVTLSAPTSFEVRVRFATADGSARVPADYTSTSSELVLPPGSTSGSVRVIVAGDTLDETDETFLVRLSDALHAAIADGEGQVTIVDDEETQISIADLVVVEGDAGTSDALFTVRLSSAADHAVTVDYSTAAGTATADIDFVAVSGRVTFATGDIAETVAVPIKGDLLLEPDETFEVRLANAAGAAIADAVAVGTILDDEDCAGPNLVLNAGAEERPAGGEIPSWQEVEGTQWLPRSTPPLPFEGLSSFSSGLAQYGELRQRVDVSAFAAHIDTGRQPFAFSARLRSSNEVPADVGRVVVEYRDAQDVVALEVFDSGDLASIDAWQEVVDTRTAPVGTRWVRVRLLTTRLTAGGNDSLFDAVSLRPLGTAAVSVDDVAVYEGNAGTRDATFTIRLSCPLGQPVSVAYATANGTAQAPGDYLTRSGSASLAAGSTTVTVAVPVVGDRIDEPHETFFVDLALAPGMEAVLADAQGKGTIWNDDFCQRSPGYWKTHQSSWAVDVLQLGGIWYYKTQLAAFLSSSSSDASLILSHHLVATKLNLERGSDPSWGATPSVLPAVQDADLFLAAHPPGSNPQGDDRTRALAIKDVLDAYNNAGCRP